MSFKKFKKHNLQWSWFMNLPTNLTMINKMDQISHTTILTKLKNMPFYERSSKHRHFWSTMNGLCVYLKLIRRKTMKLTILRWKLSNTIEHAMTGLWYNKEEMTLSIFHRENKSLNRSCYDQKTRLRWRILRILWNKRYKVRKLCLKTLQNTKLTTKQRLKSCGIR